MLVVPEEGSLVMAGAGTDFVTAQPLVAIARAMAPISDSVTAITRKIARRLDVLLFFNLEFHLIPRDFILGFDALILS